MAGLLAAHGGALSSKATLSLSGRRRQLIAPAKPCRGACPRASGGLLVQCVIPMLSGDATDQIPPDLPSYLFKERIVYLGMSLVPSVTELMMAELLYLQYDNPTKPVYLYINSTGVTKGGPSLGYEAEAFAIYDCMKFIKPPVHTCAVGNAWGEAAMLLAAGERGHRASLPSASIMIREPMNRFVRQGGMQASDLDIYRMEMRRITGDIVELLAKHTNHTEEQIRQDIARARYFSPYEAKEYGIIDTVFVPEDDVLKVVVENKLKKGSYSGL